MGGIAYIGTGIPQSLERSSIDLQHTSAHIQPLHASYLCMHPTCIALPQALISGACGHQCFVTRDTTSQFSTCADKIFAHQEHLSKQPKCKINSKVKQSTFKNLVPIGFKSSPKHSTYLKAINLPSVSNSLLQCIINLPQYSISATYLQLTYAFVRVVVDEFQISEVTDKVI
jgi:hypothetical protein